MKTKLPLFILGAVIISSANVVSAQEVMETAPNAIFVEALGNAIAYSINYDRFLLPSLGFRIGIGYFGIGAGGSSTNVDGSVIDNSISESFLIIPATLNYFLSSHDKKGRAGASKLELGAGIVYLHANIDFFGFTGSGSNIAGTATIGYRYQPPDGGFVFRIGFTPVFNSSLFQPWGGIGAGVAF